MKAAVKLIQHLTNDWEVWRGKGEANPPVFLGGGGERGVYNEEKGRREKVSVYGFVIRGERERERERRTNIKGWRKRGCFPRKPMLRKFEERGKKY